jgi:hypothetical protein
VTQGAFKESCYLLFVTKCLSQNWRVRDLYCRTYNILRQAARYFRSFQLKGQCNEIVDIKVFFRN